MARRIVIIQGHPDPRGGHFGHALSEAYRDGADASGHEVKILDVARMDFPLLRTKDDFDAGEPPAAIRESQGDLAWAEHLVIVFPLWLGEMPALLKGFLEQVLRPAFVRRPCVAGTKPRLTLGGKTARIVVTMGMPSFAYRWFFRAHGLKNLERNILRFCGIRSIRESLIGGVERPAAPFREKWLARMRRLGQEGV